MPDTVVINIITPPAEPVTVDVIEEGSITVGVNSDSPKGSLNFVIDAGNSVITTGLKGYVEWGFPATITGWTILANEVGSIVLDVWKDSYLNFTPTVADTIAGSEKPTLVNAQKNQDLSLTSFSTTVAQGDIWAFNVDSVASVKKITIAFRFNKI